MKKRSRTPRPPPTGKPPPAAPAKRVPPKEAGCPRTPVAVWLACIALAALTFAVFAQTSGFQFVNYDDGVYVYKNAEVSEGLTFHGLVLAFTQVDEANWDPLTTVSHMVDCQIYGLHAGGHHLTNVLLHAASVILLFLVLRQMTGAFWRSALVAAVFAVHPLHVESVAWVSERKDTLSGLLFMLTLGAYVRYTRRPGRVAYLLVVLFFVLGLMSKAMLVTLPFVLLLLDWWPLNRWGTAAVAGRSARSDSWWNRLPIPQRLILEKLPLLAVSLLFCAVAAMAQSQGEAIQSLAKYPLLPRLGNALHSVFVYVWQMVMPTGLAVFYPYPAHGLPVWEWILLGAALLGASFGAFQWRRRYPYVLAGWLWYLGMLAPVIGVVQLGEQAHADRYTYLPQIGLYVALIWFVAEAAARCGMRRAWPGGAAAATVAALAAGAFVQTGYWRDRETLWRHTLACTSGNALAHYNLGAGFDEKNRTAEAQEQFRQVLEINPHYAKALNNLGNIVLHAGRTNEALDYFRRALQDDPGLSIAHYNLGTVFYDENRTADAWEQFQQAVKINPHDANVLNNLGNIALQAGRTNEATDYFRRALQDDPGHATACYNLGRTAVEKGRLDEGIAEFQKALQSRPAYTDARYGLANALIRQGRLEDAMVHLRKVIQTDPDYAEAYNDAGTILLQQGNLDAAMDRFQQALKHAPDYAEAHNNLAYLLIVKNRTDEAIGHLKRALELDPRLANAHYNLGTALLQKGGVGEAIVELEAALKLEPDFPLAQHSLMEVSWKLATSPDDSARNGSRALELARELAGLPGGRTPAMLGTLAAAEAECGQYAGAATTAQQALDLTASQPDSEAAISLRRQLAEYRANRPFRDGQPKAGPVAP